MKTLLKTTNNFLIYTPANQAPTHFFFRAVGACISIMFMMWQAPPHLSHPKPATSSSRQDHHHHRHQSASGKSTKFSFEFSLIPLPVCVFSIVLLFFSILFCLSYCFPSLFRFLHSFPLSLNFQLAFHTVSWLSSFGYFGEPFAVA